MPRGNFDKKEAERALVALVVELLMCNALSLQKSLSKIGFAASVSAHKQICNTTYARAAAARKMREGRATGAERCKEMRCGEA